MYLLDTNAVIALLKNDPAAVRKRLRRALSRQVPLGVSSVVLFELWYGVARSAHARENTERLRAFMSGSIEVVRFDEDDAAVAGELRARLDEQGTPMGPYDLLIAAQALRSHSILVTANTNELARVRGLAWQNWSRRT